MCGRFVGFRSLEELKELKDILMDKIHTEFVSYPVSKQFNSARNNDPSCVEPSH